MAYQKNTPNELTAPQWCGSPLAPEHLLPGGAKVDPNQFFAPDSLAITIVGSALINATTITVAGFVGYPTYVNGTPVPAAIPNGTTISLGTNKFFTVNQVGGIPVQGTNQAVTVLAIPTALAGGETGRYKGARQTKVHVNAGIFIGRTYTERDAGTGFGPADLVTPDDEIYIVAFEIDDVNVNNDVSCVLPSRDIVIFEDFLPDWPNLGSTAKGNVRSRWTTARAIA